MITRRHDEGKIYTTVKDMATYGMQYGETYAFESFDEIPIGAAVFVFDPNDKEATTDNKGWVHVGVYIGKTDDYEYAVAEAANSQDGVGIFPLTDKYNRYGLFKGVDYYR